MDTAYATVSYSGKDPEELRILDSCEYVFQKKEKNEMLFGVFDGEETTLRISRIDFLNCELQAAVRRRKTGMEQLLKLLVKFPNQTAVINDGLFAVIASFLRYREIPEEKWGDYLMSSGDGAFRMTLLDCERHWEERGSMNFSHEDLTRFQVSLTLATDNAGTKKADA